MPKIVELKPIKESQSDYEAAEEEIKRVFKEEIYVPLIRAFHATGKRIFKNSSDGLLDGLRIGRITFNRGVFSGSFNSKISRELKALGAVWDPKGKAWKIPLKDLPLDVRNAISSSTARFEEKIAGIDQKLAQILPEEIAGKISVSQFFDRALWKVDRDFEASVKGITVAPKLTPEQRKRIADEWQKNMQLWIQDFTQTEILKLRTDIKKSVFAGNRYESAIKTIQDSYGVSANKAKFLARQETSLLMTKFKQVRYEDAGVKEYKWGCVAGSPKHPVRPWHKSLETASNRGKVYRWDDPPVTTEPGTPERRNNPGQDYNCRCFAKPIVRF